MDLKFKRKNKTLIILVAGEIDHHSSKELRSKTESALEQMGGRNIIFGFQEVTFMDSAGIGVMIGRYKQVQSLGGRIAIACPNEKIEEMIQLSGLSRLLPTFVSLDAAIAYAEGRKSDAVFFTAKSENEGFARLFAAGFLTQLDPTISEMTDVKTAVSEAVTNAIIHGYEEKGGLVELFCGYIGRKIYIEIADTGKGIENIERAREPLYTSKPEMERSGMGFTIMETFMEKVRIESRIGVGTRIFMEKTLAKE